MADTQHLVIPLWPEGAPGSESWTQVEEELVMEPYGLLVVRNVVQPTLTVYPAQQPTGASVIVAPGGAFHFLAIEHEGRQVAKWLSAHGVTAFILRYRVLRTGADPFAETQAFMANFASRAAEMAVLDGMLLADAGQAVRLVRQRAAEWSIDPRQIGFMGFSAGGAVTAQIALHYTPDCRPDFAAPIYAAVFAPVTAPIDAPPLFLLCTTGDKMAVEASHYLFSAWQAVQRPVEMHIYAHGEHGFGMRKLGLPTDRWIERFYDWMKTTINKE